MLQVTVIEHIPRDNPNNNNQWSVRIGLPHLVPLALERLQADPLAEGDLYPGDLLGSVLGIEPWFWRDHPDLRDAVESIIRRSPALPKELQDRLATFHRADPDRGGTGATS